MKGRGIPYSAEELEWIEEHKELPRAESYSMFCIRWQRDDVSLQNYKALYNRRGWKTGRTGRFSGGMTPHNKGKLMPPETRAKCVATMFKPGNVPHTYRGHGHERIDSRDGYVVMIVDEKNPWTGADTRPVHKHRYLWEQKNGPLPKDHVLKCLDGDKTNTDPANWEAIPRALLPRLAGGRHGFLPYDHAAPELRPAVLTLA